MHVLAHRGLHTGLSVPENTMAAFDAAARLGVDGIETDVRLTADGRLVLFHDHATDSGHWVSELKLHDLTKEVDYAVPTLSEAVDAWPDLVWNLELKAPEAIEALNEWGRHQRRDQYVIITSGWHPVLNGLERRVFPEVGLLFFHYPSNITPYLEMIVRLHRPTHIVWDFDYVNADTLNAARRLSVSNYVFGIEWSRDYETPVAHYLDGVITDYPEIALRLR